MNRFDMASLVINSKEDVQERIAALRVIMNLSRLLNTSILQDLEKKRKTEIDYINGVVLRQAEGTSISTPYNELVVKLVKQAEETAIVPKFETNIKFLRN